MSGGEQQMLALARAFMPGPRLLLLDEPSLGLAPLVAEIFRIVKRLNEKEGMTVLVVEQNAQLALQAATPGTCSRPAVWRSPARATSCAPRCGPAELPRVLMEPAASSGPHWPTATGSTGAP